MKLIHGDCLEQMKTLPDNSVDAIVSDPPYGISFMAKKWDYDVPKVEVWQEAMRVLKHGGHALIACGTRTQHRMVCNIEDAGFEIRDVVSWIYGSGFPKSLNISKAIDKAAGVEREVVGVVSGMGKQNPEWNGTSQGRKENPFKPEYEATAPATDAAKQWDGWGTALKPSSEFFTLCRKPLSEATIAKNVLKWGTGGINIDACRVEYQCANDKASAKPGSRNVKPTSDSTFVSHATLAKLKENPPEPNPQGRFPANLIHDGSQEVLDLFPSAGKDSAARFFYCAKASKKDRDEGNNHPTVKPTALMQYLCRLITPTGGTVLDPYMGSGSTGKAALKEGFDFIGCELDEDYYKIAQARITNEQNQ
jgi:DNA modification methylase